jgi:hypothetical protein
MGAAGMKENEQTRDAVALYKGLLRDVLDSRPSGTRQRLADAIGKNRSFVTQITNPAYSVPVPAQHLPVILEICHITGPDRERFLAAYHAAHPRRPAMVEGGRRLRHVTLDLPDFGDGARNRRFDAALRGLIQSLLAMSDETDG